MTVADAPRSSAPVVTNAAASGASRHARATDNRNPGGAAKSKGSARDTFVVGVLLSFPGASYIAAMTVLHKQHTGTAVTLIVVLASNLIMLTLLELPPLGYAVRPEWTASAVRRFSSWLTRLG